MPDLKFDSNKIYFSIFNPPIIGNPPLVPIIDNPKFLDINSNVVDVIGIKQLINGDIGITEKIMMPILKPIINTVLNDVNLSKSVAQANNLEINNKDAISAQLISNYIPKNSGMKALEKTVVSSMMESYKPLIELLKVLIELIGECEDIFCKFLGSHIKVLGNDIGIKSLNPKYWDESLNYAKTANYILKELNKSVNDATAVMDASISNKNPIKHNLPNTSGAKNTGTVDKKSLYIGYFNNKGENIEPPKWILESNKWFITESIDKNGVIKKITSPFTQLDNNINNGINQLREYQTSIIEDLNLNKIQVVSSIQKRLLEAQKITNNDLRNNEINSLNAEILLAEKSFDDISQTMKDLFDGTNISDVNYVDIEDKSKGINPPASITEWASKIKSGQLRQKYFPDQISTVQSLVDNKNKPISPFVFIPKANVNYLGKNYQIEIPLAYSNQLSQNKIYSSSLFYNNVQGNILKRYSYQNSVSSLDIYANTDANYPFLNNSKTHFSNDINKIYVPDNIKRYYNPLEWEEVLEYNVIDKQTGKVLSVEQEYVPFRIDVENDYELRLIKVVNSPLLGGDNGGSLYNYLTNDDIVIIRENGMQFFQIKNKIKNKILNFSNNLFWDKRYVDYVKDTYFILKIGVWGKKTNTDDEEVYYIQDIISNYISNNFKTSVIIDNITKTITFDNNVNIPNYILDVSNNFIINSGLNKGRVINIINIIGNVLFYSDDLISENLTKFNYSYLDSIKAQISGHFISSSNILCDIYIIKDINYIPKNINNGTLIIKGFDNNSFLNIITDKNKRQNLNLNSIDTSFDNYYKVSKTSIYKNIKNVNTQLVNIDFKLLPKKYLTIYSADKKDSIYYPLSVVALPNDYVGKPSDSIKTVSGTLFSYNNNIPNRYDDTKDKDVSSTPDINENNQLKEGIIFHGLDPRFIDEKVFWLVEAIKKDNNGLASINGKYNKKETPKNTPTTSSSDDRGKQWYGLTDKFTAIPDVSTKIIPIISKKLIPLLVKIIQLCSNPKKIQDLLLSIGLTDEDISKFPQNFTNFSSKGDLGKSKDLKNSDIPKDFNTKPPLTSNNIYMGPQTGVKKPQPICLLDGDAVIEFGKGILSKPFVFGTKLNLGNFKTISSSNKKDLNKPATGDNKSQPMFSMILNFAKMPFEIIFKIFKWIMDWVKKLVNPANISSAMKELLSFEWIKDILSKDSILGILGINLDGASNNIESLKNNITSNNQNSYSDMIKALRGNDQKYLEVLVYDILVNGIKVREEIVEKPIDSNNIKKTKTPTKGFSTKNIIETPFSGESPSYNDLDLSLMGIKPLEQIVGQLKFIQDMLNGFLAMPISILGLEPTISIPKFGKEIPFANILEDMLNEIKNNIKPIIV